MRAGTLCPPARTGRNEVDSEELAARLDAGGWQVWLGDEDRDVAPDRADECDFTAGPGHCACPARAGWLDGGAWRCAGPGAGGFG